MASFSSIGALKAEVAALGRDLATSDRRKITRAMAEKAKQIAEQTAASDVGGDRAFSGWRRSRPLRLDTRVRSLSDGDALLVPTRAGAGPWTVAERGRNQGRARGTGRRWNGRTAGKRTASKAVDRMEDAVQPIAERGVKDAIRRHFDVS